MKPVQVSSLPDKPQCVYCDIMRQTNTALRVCVEWKENDSVFTQMYSDVYLPPLIDLPTSKIPTKHIKVCEKCKITNLDL